jgi:hypothetical protein
MSRFHSSRQPPPSINLNRIRKAEPSDLIGEANGLD